MTGSRNVRNASPMMESPIRISISFSAVVIIAPAISIADGNMDFCMVVGQFPFKSSLLVCGILKRTTATMTVMTVSGSI